MMVMWVFRLFAFNLPESPTYLMSRGRDEDAVAVVHKVATINGNISNLTVAHLKGAEILTGDSKIQTDTKMVTSTSAMRKFSEFHASHVMPLFATRVLAYSTSILIVLWGEEYFSQILGTRADRFSLSFDRACDSFVSDPLCA